MQKNKYDSIMTKQSGVSKVWPKTKSSALPIFVNKVLLEHSHVRLYELSMIAYTLQGL